MTPNSDAPPVSDHGGIAVAVDGSGPAELALQRAIDIARQAASELVIVAVVPERHAFTPEGRSLPETDREAERFLREVTGRYVAVARAAGVSRVSTAVLAGPAVEQLLSFVDERRPDLLVVGARGLSTTRRLLLGSVSDALVHHAGCSVLVVRDPEGSKRAVVRRPTPAR